ncbi:MAG: glycosyltransferase family 2 protein [Anaerolineae bacterium]
MTAKVAIVIVNFNGERYLKRCLTSVLALTYPSFEVVLVDNGSSDGSVSLVREQFPPVQIIEAGENVGFAKGNNVGIQATDTPLVATLNNDTWVEPDWLEQLVRVMESDPRIGTCASKMLFAHQPEIINSAGVCVDPVGIAWDRLGGTPETRDTTEPMDVFAACAGAALYRRAMLEDVGLFDEDYFIYLEDVDLSWRSQLMGWRTVYVPQARVYHVHSGTTQEASPFKNFHLGRNKVWMVVKNYPSPQFWLYLPLILLYDLGSIPYSLLARGETAALRGRLAALRRLPEAWRKRREIQKRRRASFEDLEAVLSPLENPLALLRRYEHLASLPSTEEPTAGQSP